MTTPSVRQDLLGILEGFYLTQIVDTLLRNGALADLHAGIPLDRIADARRLDPSLLAILVAYLRARTAGIVPDVDGRDEAIDGTYLGHLLDQYKGAFGPCLAQLDAILRAPETGPALIDWERHGEAFGAAGRGASNAFPLRLLAELNVDCIVDLGCSAGGFLLDFAEQNPRASGWGVDSSPAAIDAARRAADTANLAGRLEFRVADAFEPAASLSPGEREQVQLITAFNIANAFFDPRSGKGLTAWLQKLSAAFPNRLLLLCDYYGRVGSSTAGQSHRYRRAMLHDIAQAITMQGIPPAERSEWVALLESAGVTLVKAFEGNHDEVAHFMYLIQI